MAETSRHRPTQARDTGRSSDSQHSHFEFGSTHGNWDRGESTDFAITTVDVPDRLDAQEVRARAATEAASPSVSRFRAGDAARVFRWLLVFALIGALVWGALKILVPVRAAISRSGVEAGLSRVLGVPVSVRSTELRYLPSPQLVVTDVTVQSGFRLPEVVIHFNWRDAVRGLQSANWVLGEAHVAPLKLGGQEALALLQAVRPASNLPAAVSVVRFGSVEFPDMALLPGRYEAVIRRGIDQREFNSVSLQRLDAEGQLDIEVTPPAAGGGNARFAMFATKWTAPFGPGNVWSEATAQGEFRGDAVKVDSYSVGTPFGNLNGAASLDNDGRGWKLEGNVRGPDLNVEQLLFFLAGTSATGDANRPQAPVRGTARFDLAAAGNGGTVVEALQRASVAGHARVDGAVVSGVNLGLAATQGDPGGTRSVTRFTNLEFDVVGTHRGLTIRNITGRAGNLKVSGAVDVDAGLGVSGLLRSEVSSPRGVASAQTRVTGTATAPSFQ